VRSVPWADGTRELLQHSVDYLDKGGDFDRRIAMICIDNSVELMIRTFLSLPRRARGTAGPTRKELEESQNSFPMLLDLLERYGSDRLNGIALDEIEWFHKIRNDLYHSGQGVTVELAKAEAYIGIAITLFRNLFGVDLELSSINQKEELIGHFLGTWGLVEAKFYELRPSKPSGEYAYYWNREYLSRINKKAADLWHNLSYQRNIVIHSPGSLEASDLIALIKDTEELLTILKRQDKSYKPEGGEEGSA